MTSGRSVISASTPHPSRRRASSARVDRPHLHAEAGVVRVLDEPRRDDARASRPLGNLVAGVGDARDRPAEPRPVERPSHFFARAAGRDRRLERPRRAQHAQTERSETDTVDSAGAADDVDRRRRELGAVHLHLDDDPRDRDSARGPRQAAARPRAAAHRRSASAIGPTQRRSCDPAAGRDARRRRRRARGGRRARGRRPRAPGRCRTPRWCSPARARCRRDARTPAGAATKRRDGARTGVYNAVLL